MKPLIYLLILLVLVGLVFLFIKEEPVDHHQEQIDSLVADRTRMEIQLKQAVDSMNLYKESARESYESSLREQAQKIYIQKRYEQSLRDHHNLKPSQLDSAILAELAGLR